MAGRKRKNKKKGKRRKKGTELEKGDKEWNVRGRNE
jgi:hypothetical protein